MQHIVSPPAEPQRAKGKVARQDGTVQDGTVQDGTVQDGTVQDGVRSARLEVIAAILGDSCRTAQPYVERYNVQRGAE